jgi:hypothetical protein
MVDLFSRETMLKFLPDRKMKRVCQAIMKRIIFSRGVPDELRSDNAPGPLTDSDWWGQPQRGTSFASG